MGCGASKIDLEPKEIEFYALIGLNTDDVNKLYHVYEKIDMKKMGGFTLDQWLLWLKSDVRYEDTVYSESLAKRIFQYMDVNPDSRIVMQEVCMLL